MSSASDLDRVLDLQDGDDRLTAAMISDSLDVVGLRNQTTTRLDAVVPGAFILGRARTVQFAPTDVDTPEGPYDDAIAYIDSLRQGHIAVCATDGNDVTAYWGELFSAAARGRGAVGAITDGAVRDSAKIRDLGFPVYSATRRPTDFRARMRIESVQQPVSFHGIPIEDGDLIAIDDDGMVVVPQSAEEKVMELARARARAESHVLSDLLGGASLRSVWDRYRIL